MNAEKTKKILELAGKGVFSLRDIAKQVHCSPSTVSLKIQRAKENLQKNILPENIQPKKNAKKLSADKSVKNILCPETSRCPGCGRVIALPCLACALESKNALEIERAIR